MLHNILAHHRLIAPTGGGSAVLIGCEGDDERGT